MNIIKSTHQLSNNLNYLLDKKEISATKLARELNLPAATIKNIRHGDNLNPTIATLFPIAQYFSVTISQLVGEEPLLEKLNAGVILSVPLFSWEEVLQWPATEGEQRVNFLDTDYSDSIDFALRVNNDELKEFSKDAILFINASVTPEHRDFVIIQNNSKQTAVLRQWLDEGDGIYLRTLSDKYPLVVFKPEYKVLGVVYGVKKKIK